jgi:hypothetical protein
VAWPAQKLLDYIVWIAGRVSELPNAAQEVAVSWAWALGIYAVLAGAMFYLKWRTKHNFRDDNFVE